MMFFIIRICLWIIGPYLITYYFILDTIENELYDIISKDIQKFWGRNYHMRFAKRNRNKK